MTHSDRTSVFGGPIKKSKIKIVVFLYSVCCKTGEEKCDRENKLPAPF